MPQLTVKGMHCKSCKMLIEEELEDIGATNINVSFDEDTQIGNVSFTGVDEKKAITAIEELGDYEIQ